MKDVKFVVRVLLSAVNSLLQNFCLCITVRFSADSDHHINSYPVDNSANQPHLRSNDRYDHLLMIKEKNDAEIEKFASYPLGRFAKNQLKQRLLKSKQSEYGILGPCVLRQLTCFDVGFSFLSDNLHNVYHEVFVIETNFGDLTNFFHSHCKHVFKHFSRYFTCFLSLARIF